MVVEAIRLCVADQRTEFVISRFRGLDPEPEAFALIIRPVDDEKGPHDRSERGPRDG